MNEFNTYSKSYSTARYTRLIYLDSLLVGSLYSPYLYYLVGLVILALVLSILLSRARYTRPTLYQ